MGMLPSIVEKNPLELTYSEILVVKDLTNKILKDEKFAEFRKQFNLNSVDPSNNTPFVVKEIKPGNEPDTQFAERMAYAAVASAKNEKPFTKTHTPETRASVLKGCMRALTEKHQAAYLAIDKENGSTKTPDGKFTAREFSPFDAEVMNRAFKMLLAR